MPISNSKPLRLIVWVASVIAASLVLWLSSQQLIRRHELARWNPNHAVADAQNDIKLGRIKIYLHGTIVSQAVGVAPSQMQLIRSLPTESAGVGCVIDDWSLRTSQGEYAKLYNQTIVRYLQSKPQ